MLNESRQTIYIVTFEGIQKPPKTVLSGRRLSICVRVCALVVVGVLKCDREINILSFKNKTKKTPEKKERKPTALTPTLFAHTYILFNCRSQQGHKKYMIKQML